MKIINLTFYRVRFFDYIYISNLNTMKHTLKILSCILLINSIISCSTTQNVDNKKVEMLKYKKSSNGAIRALDRKIESSKRQLAIVNN